MDFLCTFWTFIHKKVRFTGLYAALSGSGLPEENDRWKMLEGLATAPSTSRHVVITHYPLFLDSMDEPTLDPAKPDEYSPWYFSMAMCKNSLRHQRRLSRCYAPCYG